MNSIIRLLPDDFRLILYTQFDWEEGEEFKVFDPKVNYVALHRNQGYKLHTKRHLTVIAVNLKCLNPEIDEDRLKQALEYIVEQHFYRGFPESTLFNNNKGQRPYFFLIYLFYAQNRKSSNT